jgi:gas vesicle protein
MGNRKQIKYYEYDIAQCSRQLEWGLTNPSCKFVTTGEELFMRIGKYESSEGNTAATAVTFLLIGLGAGTLIGLLFAPKAGKQMRKDLRRKYDDARETLDDWKDEAKEVAEDALERGQEIAEELRDRVAPLAAAMKRR